MSQLRDAAERKAGPGADLALTRQLTGCYLVSQKATIDDSLSEYSLLCYKYATPGALFRIRFFDRREVIFCRVYYYVVGLSQ
jgi:hypothetical protein